MLSVNVSLSHRARRRVQPLRPLAGRGPVAEGRSSSYAGSTPAPAAPQVASSRSASRSASRAQADGRQPHQRSEGLGADHDGVDVEDQAHNSSPAQASNDASDASSGRYNTWIHDEEAWIILEKLQDEVQLNSYNKRLMDAQSKYHDIAEEEWPDDVADLVRFKKMATNNFRFAVTQFMIDMERHESSEIGTLIKGDVAQRADPRTIHRHMGTSIGSGSSDTGKKVGYDDKGITLLVNAVDMLMLEVLCTQPVRVASSLAARKTWIRTSHDKSKDMVAGKIIRYTANQDKHLPTIRLTANLAHACEGMQYVGPAFTILAAALTQAGTMIEADSAWLEVLLHLVLVFELLLPLTDNHQGNEHFFQSAEGTLHGYMLKKVGCV
eukprot:352252-Chlamydomonas_euryale.AAC.8